MAEQAETKSEKYKKKFDWKTVLIVILALITAFLYFTRNKDLDVKYIVLISIIILSVTLYLIFTKKKWMGEEKLSYILEKIKEDLKKQGRIVNTNFDNVLGGQWLPNLDIYYIYFKDMSKLFGWKIGIGIVYEDEISLKQFKEEMTTRQLLSKIALEQLYKEKKKKIMEEKGFELENE